MHLSAEEERLQNLRKQEKYEEIIRNQRLNNHHNTHSEPQDIRVYGNSNQTPSEVSTQERNGLLRKIFKIVISFLIIISILISIVFVGLYSLCSKTNYVEDKFSKDENIFDTLINIGSDYNILLIGTDKSEDGVSRSDTMMLITIDKDNQKLKITSLMRDLWVKIPEHGSQKLNAAYAIGGTDLLIETIENNFKININNYVLVDFEMFINLIDSIGGVTVEITEKEAEFMNRTTQAKVNSGQFTLDGKNALIYCRIRKLDSDFMRTQRQRKVITSLVNKIKEQDLITNFNILVEILPLVQTNIPPFKMSAEALTAVPVLNYEVEQFRIPVDGQYDSTYINGQSVLLPDYEANINSLKEFLTN